MRVYLVLTLLVMHFSFLFSQGIYEWSETELTLANTAIGVEYLSDIEKEVVLYTNLVRLYPKKFNRIEILRDKSIENSSYKNSLIKDLNLASPMSAIYPNEELTSSASCLAIEQSISGKTGHKRKECPEVNNFAENCSYGHNDGRAIVVSLLVDYEVKSLGHRKNILNSKIKTIGLKNTTHSKLKWCTVINYSSIEKPIWVETEVTTNFFKNQRMSDSIPDDFEIDVRLLRGHAFQNTNRLYNRDTTLVKFVNDSIIYLYNITSDSIVPSATLFYEFEYGNPNKCKITVYPVLAVNTNGSYLKSEPSKGIITFIDPNQFIWRENTGTPKVRPVSFYPLNHRDNVTFVKSNYKYPQ